MPKVGALCLSFFSGFCGMAAFGQERRPEFLENPADHYGSRLLIGLLIAGILLVLYSLVRYRGRIEGALSWGFLIAGVVALPTTSIMLGMVLVFERAERVEFCGSCHRAMQAYVRDIENPKSESLAAIHYKNRYIPRNQCYTCHTSFGLFGTAQAKIAGVIDVAKYYTGNFHFPLRMREPYPNDECLKCHYDSIRWGARHQDVKNELVVGESRCQDCHGTEHPAHILSE
jgi:nitrate/TMAO reductase-like tetraheme cytochrome c subunit